MRKISFEIYPELIDDQLISDIKADINDRFSVNVITLTHNDVECLYFTVEGEDSELVKLLNDEFYQIGFEGSPVDPNNYIIALEELSK